MTKGKMLVTFFAVVTVTIFTTILVKNYNKPVSYEDCIMKAMDGVQSDVAARMKAAACRKMFPVELTYEQAFGISK